MEGAGVIPGSWRRSGGRCALEKERRKEGDDRWGRSVSLSEVCARRLETRLTCGAGCQRGATNASERAGCSARAERNAGLRWGGGQRRAGRVARGRPGERHCWAKRGVR